MDHQFETQGNASEVLLHTTSNSSTLLRRKLKGFADLNIMEEDEEQSAVLHELLGGPSPLVQPACLREDSSSSVNEYFASRGIPMSASSAMNISPSAPSLPSPCYLPSPCAVNDYFTSRGIPIFAPPTTRDLELQKLIAEAQKGGYVVCESVGDFFVPVAGNVGFDPHMYLRSSTCPNLFGANTNTGPAMGSNDAVRASTCPDLMGIANIRAPSHLTPMPCSPTAAEQMQLQAMFLAAQHSGHVSAAPPHPPSGY